MTEIVPKPSVRYFAEDDNVTVDFNPRRRARYAPVPVIIATATPKICDSDETDPITNSGDGMANATVAEDTKKSPKNMMRQAVSRRKLHVEVTVSASPKRVGVVRTIGKQTVNQHWLTGGVRI